jgi:DNA ligase-associated metallophosphoesterase
MSDLILAVRGETLHLMPERAAFWPATRTLIIADVHWGKAATFRSAGVPVPGGGTADDLARLDSALERTCARRLLVLGDLFHARAGRIATRTLATLRAWRERTAGLEITLVRGNHDRHAGDPPSDLRINCVDAPAHAPPFVLRHEPAPSPEGYVLAGHVHPGAALRGRGRRRERLPCFVMDADTMVLPAFGGFTGLATVEPDDACLLYVIAGDEVLPTFTE